MNKYEGFNPQEPNRNKSKRELAQEAADLRRQEEEEKIKQGEDNLRELFKEYAKKPIQPPLIKAENRIPLTGKLWNEGVTGRQIAIDLGVSQSTVTKDLNELKKRGVEIKPRKSGRKPKQS
jgi:biotin operon repressor